MKEFLIHTPSSVSFRTPVLLSRFCAHIRKLFELFPAPLLRLLSADIHPEEVNASEDLYGYLSNYVFKESSTSFSLVRSFLGSLGRPLGLCFIVQSLAATAAAGPRELLAICSDAQLWFSSMTQIRGSEEGPLRRRRRRHRRLRRACPKICHLGRRAFGISFSDILGFILNSLLSHS